MQNFFNQFSSFPSFVCVNGKQELLFIWKSAIYNVVSQLNWPKNRTIEQLEALHHGNHRNVQSAAGGE